MRRRFAAVFLLPTNTTQAECKKCRERLDTRKSTVLENFCENLCHIQGAAGGHIPATVLLSPQRPSQQVAQNQIRLSLCDLLRPKNSVAETKISRKILQYTQGDSSLLRSVVQLVAATQVTEIIRWGQKNQNSKKSLDQN